MGRKRLVPAGAALLLLIAAPAEAGWERVKGDYLQLAPCIPTGGTPDATLTRARFECSGTTTWAGHLSGQTLITNARGTVDLADGTTRGTADETIFVIARGGRAGTLEMRSTFRTDGIEFSATNHVLRGTGDFTGAKGRITFGGMVLGTGWYDGWLHTQPSSSRR